MYFICATGQCHSVIVLIAVGLTSSSYMYKVKLPIKYFGKFLSTIVYYKKRALTTEQTPRKTHSGMYRDL